MHDLIVLGGGPAGLTATVYGLRKRLNVLLITGNLGGKTNYHLQLPFIKKTPCDHRQRSGQPLC
jgi:thioredoxin reductase